MRVSRAAEGSFTRGDDEGFTGEVWLRSTLAADDEYDEGFV